MVIYKKHSKPGMSSVESKGTKPELIVRTYLWKCGFRYRINSVKLPGKLDIVLRKYRCCIFINGCFWHGHEGCKLYRIPQKNSQFWIDKIERNKKRDVDVQKKLAAMGWHCITIWECEFKPKIREKTLRSLEYTLNHIYIKNHSIRYQLPEEYNNDMAAEP